MQATDPCAVGLMIIFDPVRFGGSMSMRRKTEIGLIKVKMINRDSGQVAFPAPLPCDAVLTRVNAPGAVEYRRRDGPHGARDPGPRGNCRSADALTD